jgi:SNF2 family DNA or RNA helicase
MLRRLKKDVLTQLPDKQRQKIIIETNKTITKEITFLMEQSGNDMKKP